MFGFLSFFEETPRYDGTYIVSFHIFDGNLDGTESLRSTSCLRNVSHLS